MLDRRELLKGSLIAGLFLGTGSLVSSCAGARRGELPEGQGLKGHAVTLDETARTILYHASLAPSGHNSQPWRVRIESPTVWMVEIDETRQLPVVDPNNRELLLSIGAFVENLTITAGSLGFKAETKVISNNHTAVRIVLHKDKATGYPLERIKNRRTVKHGQLSREIRTEDVDALFGSLGQHQFYFPRGSKHADCIMNATVECYRSQTHRDDAQQELVRWLRLSHRDAGLHRDGLSTEGMELNGLKGWFLRNFVKPESFLKENFRQQGIDMTAELARQGGGWLIITSPGQNVEDIIETGRRFERMALLAREYGIGIHPMTQVLEEKQGIDLFDNHHGSAIIPQFVLRVGYLEEYPEPVSLRRPVEWFVTV